MSAGVIVLWRFQVCHTPYVEHTVRLLRTTHSPCSAPHYASVQHGHRPANTITLHTCSTSMASGHMPFHVHSLQFMGVRGHTEFRNLKRQRIAYCYSSSGCAVQVVGGHASARLVQFAAEYAKRPQVSVCVWGGVLLCCMWPNTDVDERHLVLATSRSPGAAEDRCAA